MGATNQKLAKKPKIVLTGGGTAGHVSPNLALTSSLEADGWEVVYIGSNHGLEKQLVAEAGIPYHGISSGKLRRYFSCSDFDSHSSRCSSNFRHSSDVWSISLCSNRWFLSLTSYSKDRCREVP